MRLTILLSVLFLASCQTDEPNQSIEQAVYTKLSPQKSGIDFINEVVGQENFNVLTYRNYYNGGGVAIGDINNDQLADLYFTANMKPNKLYLNAGGLQFEDITESAGTAGTMSWSTGVTMADVNGDGWIDIYVCNSGNLEGAKKENELFINNRDNTFTESAGAYGLNDAGYSTHASFFDYDMDGDLDMYLVNNSFKDPSRIDFTNIRHIRDEEGGDKLFRNNGTDQFEDVSEEAGIYGSEIGFGLGVSVSDLNGDNWPDIYVSNDFWERDYLYINQQDGTFSEELPQRIPLTSTASMGADIADLDNNGTYEIFSTDMLPSTNERLKKTTIFNDYNLQDLKYRSDYHYQYTQNCLQINDGNANFTEAAHMFDLAATDWSWGALILDFDNDGYKDIFVSNGVYHDITDLDFSDFIEDQEEVEKIVREKGRFDFNDFLEYLPSTNISNYAFHNRGNLRFENKAEAFGLGDPSFSNGSAYGDLDNDGDLEIVVNNVNSVSQIFENRSEKNGNHYIKLSFNSTTRNRNGIGASVKIYADGFNAAYQNYTSRGFQSSTEPILTIGLGNVQKIDSIHVSWPGNLCSTLIDVSVDQWVTLDQPTEICKGTESKKNSSLLQRLEPYTNTAPSHIENVFNDFDFEPLMPHMVSTEGPEVLVADFDKNGLEDFILLGSSGQSDQVYLQQVAGSFSEQAQPAMIQDQAHESTCGLVIDLDNDGDQDIVIGSGGNEPTYGPERYLVRAYLNNGAGQFTKAERDYIQAFGNFSVIEEISLSPTRRAMFFGGRIVPGNYGLDPRNYLMVQENDGPWVDVTTESTGKLGMVTDARAVDLDNDNDEDLVVVGEWMPITIFENENSILVLRGTITGSFGWWQTIETGDLNGDGLEDLIGGNWGKNSKFQASIDKPLRMLVNDFDQNGKTECIIQWYAPEDSDPTLFASKNDLTRQLPVLKKVILKNAQYATKDLEDIFTAEQINSSVTKYANNLYTSTVINNGEFRFNLAALPVEAQFSPVYAICPVDINGDDILDLVLGGNVYGLKPEVGRLNSSKGLVLIGIGNGKFRTANASESGLEIEGEIRDIRPIKLQNNRSALIFGVNNMAVSIYEYQ